MFAPGCIAAVSTHDQQTLTLQMRAMCEYAAKRGWTIAAQIKGGWFRRRRTGNSARNCSPRPAAARSMLCLSGRLDRWGRLLVDLVVT